MSVRYVLAPQAALDLVEIWRYIKEQTSPTIADRVEAAKNSYFWHKRRAPATAARISLTRT
jgi:plasmid stabilization system protein ParE